MKYSICPTVKPAEIICDEIRGCCEQCPFCKEQCEGRLNHALLKY